jgi:acyl dehydratase
MTISQEAGINLYYFDDFKEGQFFEAGSIAISREEIIDFARKYDPQPFHVDEDKAKTIYGGLIASGWHTVCLCSRMMVDSLLNKTAGMGSPGVDELRFLKPVRPGNILSGRFTIIGLKPSERKADRGSIKLKGEMSNQDGEVVLSLIGTIIIARRPH